MDTSSPTGPRHSSTRPLRGVPRPPENHSPGSPESRERQQADAQQSGAAGAPHGGSRRLHSAAAAATNQGQNLDLIRDPRSLYHRLFLGIPFDTRARWIQYIIRWRRRRYGHWRQLVFTSHASTQWILRLHKKEKKIRDQVGVQRFEAVRRQFRR